VLQICSEEELLLGVFNWENILAIHILEHMVCVNHVEMQTVGHTICSHRVIANAKIWIAGKFKDLEQ
jgi:hypothetical protein